MSVKESSSRSVPMVKPSSTMVNRRRRQVNPVLVRLSQFHGMFLNSLLKYFGSSTTEVRSNTNDGNQDSTVLWKHGVKSGIWSLSVLQVRLTFQNSDPQNCFILKLNFNLQLDKSTKQSKWNSIDVNFIYRRHLPHISFHPLSFV